MSDPPVQDAFPALVRTKPGSRRILAWSTIVLIIGSALGQSVLRPSRPLLVWNASPSSRVGLYRLNARALPRTGDIVVAWAPAAARRLAAARHYLPSSVPLVKRVAAVAGDRVCAHGSRISINGREVSRRRSRDPSGRPLPWWSGCRLLAGGETFLLSPGRPDAFDGRYFGPSGSSDLVGTAWLLWAKPANGSRDGEP